MTYDADPATATAATPIDFVINGKSLREFLRANMHDGDEGGQITMPVKFMLDETVEVVGMWIHEGFRYDN